MMPVRGIFQMKGLEEYLANIQAAGNDVDNAAAEAVEAGGDLLREAVEANAKPYRDSGDMENTISRTEVQRDGNYTYVEVVVDPHGEIPYEQHVEYGTSDTPARGFFRAAIDHGRSKVRAIWRQIFKAKGLAS